MEMGLEHLSALPGTAQKAAVTQLLKSWTEIQDLVAGTILPFLSTIHTQMSRTEIMWTEVLQETWHFEIRSIDPHAAVMDNKEMVSAFPVEGK